jgi:hypothetical protein
MLSSGRFQLETLSCAESLASSNVLSSHPSLQVLGLFVGDATHPNPALGVSSMLVLRISPCVPDRKPDPVTLFPELLGDGIVDSKELSNQL